MLRFVSLSCLVSLAAAQGPVIRESRNTFVPLLSYPLDAATGDVDGDGDLDMVVAVESTGNQLLLNDGRARFVDATAGRLTTPTSPVPFNTTREVDLADIDGDLDLDLLVCTDNWHGNRVHLNNGAGVFTDVTATALPINFGDSMSQVVADFDGDGDVDWFVSDQDGIALYLNNGVGVFTLTSPTGFASLAFGWSEGCFTMDFEGDGDPDIVVVPMRSQFPPQAVRVLLNQGNLVFTLAPTGFLPIAAAYTALPVDIDGDGVSELIVNGTRLLRYSTAGVFVDVTAAHLPGMVQSLNVRSAFDVDRDGDPDLVTHSYQGGIWWNDGSGLFTNQPHAIHNVSGQTVLGDFDDDGDTDIVDLTSSEIATNFTSQLETPVAARNGQIYTANFHVRPGAQPTYLMPFFSTSPTYVPFVDIGAMRVDVQTGFIFGIYTQSGGPLSFSWQFPAGAFIGVELHLQALVLDPVTGLRFTNAVRDVIE